MRWLLIVLSLCVLLPFQAQYTYFNSISGSIQDSLTDNVLNIEIIGDTIYTYGHYGDFVNGRRFRLSKVDMNGILQNERFYNDPLPIMYKEVTGSFKKKMTNDGFYFSCGGADSIVSGFAGEINLNLDTIWTKRYDQFSPHTYFKRNFDVGDGITIAGQWDGAANQVGTMLSKINYDGELLWSQVLQPSGGNIINTFDIIEHQGYLVVAGSQRINGMAPEGTITKCALDGTPLWEYIDDDVNLGTLPYYLCETTESRLLAATSVRYGQAGSSPISYFMKIRIRELDIINEQFIWEQEYFFNEEMDNAYMNKILSTSDGGALILGTDITDYLDAQNEFKAFLLKIDSLGNEEWFNYYAYEYGNDHMSTAYDVEQSSDGGYIVAGEYSDWNVSNSLPRGWLFKIDACGELEWQGCEPVGLGELEMKSSVTLYPNPVVDYLNISVYDNMKAEEIEIFDVSGSMVLNASYNDRIDVSDLGMGIYLLRILSENGVIHSKKLIVE